MSFFLTFIFKPTLLAALIAALSSMEMFSIFSRLKLFCQAFLFAMSRGVEVSTVSIILRLFSFSDEPVSVSSTIASSSWAFISVAPQLNSTFTSMFLSAKYFFVTLTSSVAISAFRRSWGFLTFDSLETARTHLVGLFEVLLYISSQTSTTSEPFSVIQS